MKIWLDDVRNPPDDSWAWAKNAQDFFGWLADYKYTINEISFDHDIASFDANGREISGYDCLCVIEKLFYTDCDFNLPKMSVHSANPVGRMKMQKLINNLEIIYGK